MVIPVPIPNTEVKHFRDENTLYGEDSSLPVLYNFYITTTNYIIKLKGKIIFLNGCSSAGKSSITTGIKNLSEEP